MKNVAISVLAVMKYWRTDIFGIMILLATMFEDVSVGITWFLLFVSLFNS